jgi:hypothetical protein
MKITSGGKDKGNLVLPICLFSNLFLFFVIYLKFNSPFWIPQKICRKNMLVQHKKTLKSTIYNTILHVVYLVYLHELDTNSWPGNFEEEDEDLDADPDADADLQVVE